MPFPEIVEPLIPMPGPIEEIRDGPRVKSWDPDKCGRRPSASLDGDVCYAADRGLNDFAQKHAADLAAPCPPQFANQAFLNFVRQQNLHSPPRREHLE